MDISELGKELETGLKGFKTDLDGFIQKSNAEAGEQAKFSKKTEETMKSLDEKLGEYGERMLDLEQKATSRNDVEDVEKSLGMLFTESDVFSAFKGKQTQKASFFSEKNTIVGADATVAPNRLAGVVGGAFRNLRIADSITQGNTSSNAIEYTRENVLTNNAAEAAENAAKPESDVTFALVQKNSRLSVEVAV